MGQIQRPAYWTATGMILMTALSAGATAPAFGADPCKGYEDDSQKVATIRREKCDAKKAAEKASTNDKISAGLWSAVTVVCGLACAKQWMDDGSWCTYSAIGGALADAALSKDVAQSIATSMPFVLTELGKGDKAADAKAADAKTPPADATKTADSAGGSATQGSGPSFTDKVKEKAKDSSCQKMVLSGAKAFMKYSSAKKQSKMANDFSTQAAQLVDHQGTTVALGGGGGDATTTGIGGKNGTLGGRPAAGGSDSPSSGACNQAAQGSNDAGAHISCALASDSTLAPLLDPKFKEEFEKNTGQKLGDYLANAANNGPEASMMSGMAAGGMSPDKLSDIAGALGKTKNALNYDAGPIVASRGSGGAANAESGPDMGEMMAGLMSQLMPKEGEGEPPAGFSLIDYKSLTRSPSAVAEDRSINIFQRVSFRYHYVGRRVLSGGR